MNKSNTTVDASPIQTTIIYYITFIGLGLITASLGPTLLALAELTGTTLSQISILFTIKSLGFLCGAVVAGRLYDRIPGHPIIIIILLSLALMTALVPTVSWLWLLIPIIFLVGFGLGSLDVGGNTLLVWLHQEKVGPYMNGLHFVWGVGAFLSPLLITQAISFGGDVRWAYWLLALLILPIALGFIRRPSPQAAATDEGEAEKNRTLIPLFLISLFFFLYISAEAGISGWIFTYTVDLKLTSEANAAYLNSAFFGALTLARLIGIPLATRFKASQLLFGELLICLASVTLILFFPTSLTGLWAGVIGLGAGMALLFPAMLDLAQRYVTITGKVNSWFFVGGSLGGMSSPWVIGQLFEPIGPSVVMFVILGSLLAAMAILIALVKTQKER